jgi:hypothetical protein
MASLEDLQDLSKDLVRKNSEYVALIMSLINDEEEPEDLRYRVKSYLDLFLENFQTLAGIIMRMQVLKQGEEDED